MAKIEQYLQPGVRTKLFGWAIFTLITYDSATKGDNLIISMGQPDVVYSHIVNQPTELWVAEAESGQALALQIKDSSDTQTILRFES
jgi:hypothetical protein